MKRNTLFIIFFLINNLSFSQTANDSVNTFLLRGSVKMNGKAISGVSLELSKDGKLINSVVTSKGGKYSFRMGQSTIDNQSEYNSKEGTVAKTLIINTYVPKDRYTYDTYVFDLEVSLVESAAGGMDLMLPMGKIRWDIEQDAYVIDQSQQENEKLIRELAKRKADSIKNVEMEIAKQLELKQNKEQALAKQRADSLALVKLVEETERLKKEELLAAKQKALADSLALVKKEQTDAAKAKYALQKLEMQKVKEVVLLKNEIEMPVEIIQLTNPFGNKEMVLAKEERNKQNEAKKAVEKKKALNLSTKYETSNALTSLLDAVDEYDKKLKGL